MYPSVYGSRRRMGIYFHISAPGGEGEVGTYLYRDFPSARAGFSAKNSVYEIRDTNGKKQVGSIGQN